MRGSIAALLAGTCVLATTACGSARPSPRHGILFAHGAGAALAGGSLYLSRPGAKPRQLAGGPLLFNEPAWSPDGEQFAFTMTSCPANSDAECSAFYELYVARSDGSHRRELTFSASDEFRSQDPSWSPDGSRIVFQREFDNYTKLAIVSVASGRIRYLGVSGLQPTWGRPGIAYLVHRRWRHNHLAWRNAIRLVVPQTEHWRPFVAPPVGRTFQSVTWSPRDELAALEGSLAHRYGVAQRVAIFSATGRLLSHFEVPEHWSTCGMSWSPDGKHLLLTVYRRSNFGRKTERPKPQPYLVDPHGRHWRPVRLGLRLSSCDLSWR